MLFLLWVLVLVVFGWLVGSFSFKNSFLYFIYYIYIYY